MTVWSSVKVSELHTGKRLGAEFYHPDKLRALALLKSRSSETVEDSFAHVRTILNPSKAARRFTVPTFLFGLSDIEGHFLGDGLRVSDPAEVGSAKKVFGAGDVLISRLRPYLREIALAHQEDGMLLASTELIVLRQKKGSLIAGEFLFVFLMTKEVQDILLWSQEGTNHPRFPESVLRELPLPRPDENTTTQVTELVRRANRSFRDSREIYVRAERMVLEELGWDTVDLSQPKWWAVPLCQAREIQRLDADHFQPRYDKLIAHLKKTEKARPLREIAAHIKRGVQPRYAEGGEVLAINSRYVGKQLINTEQAERTDAAFWNDNPRARAYKHDVVMNSTGVGTIGRTNCVLHDDKTVVDNHVTIIRVKEGECKPAFLAVYLNSAPGLMQTDMWLSGSSGQLELYPADIERFVVYLASDEVQARVADLVRQSYQAREKAKALLEEAKRKVEAMIEGAADHEHSG
jgi:type I restriction enzyme S subunit